MPCGGSPRRRESIEPRLDLLFYALSDSTRRALLSRLALGPAKVTDLARPFRMSLPAVSKHLKVLEEARLVSRTIDGRVHRLAIQADALRHVETWLDPFRAYWEGSLSALRLDIEDHPTRLRGRRGRSFRPPRGAQGARWTWGARAGSRRLKSGIPSPKESMNLGESLIEVWRQSMVEHRPEVELAGQRCRVTQTRGQGLLVVLLQFEGRVIEGIEQNPRKESRWAKLAQEGKRIMQFRIQRRYIGNVCEGQLLRYPAWKSLGLPE